MKKWTLEYLTATVTYSFKLTFIPNDLCWRHVCFCFAILWKLGLNKLFLWNKCKTLQAWNKQTIFFNPSRQCYQKVIHFVQSDKTNVTYNFFAWDLSYRLLKIQRSLPKQKSRVIWRKNFRMSGMSGNLGLHNFWILIFLSTL